MTVRRAALVAIGIVLVVLAGCSIGREKAIAPIASHPAFPPDEVARGAVLAAIGDCAGCHTLPEGLGVDTPFGVVHATNITPDDKTGIGTWSAAAFRRAMREGVARDGRHLYPAFPYPHFTHATDADIDALYAFLMTRQPVVAKPVPNSLPFPLNQRALLAEWNRLYLDRSPWRPDPAHDAVWNRGAYLVEAIGHCGACHTPHTMFGAERTGDALGGGDVDDWYAPPLQQASPAGTPWTVAGMTAYLRDGFDAGHGAAAGPMTAVTDELAAVPQPDVEAMAAYIVSLMPRAPAQAAALAPATGNPVFAGACGGCHGKDTPMRRAGAPPLSVSTAVNADDPRDAVQVILRGIPAREGKAAPFMPPFAGALTDAQVADLAMYLRSRFTGRAAWKISASDVAAIRRGS